MVSAFILSMFFCVSAHAQSLQFAMDDYKVTDTTEKIIRGRLEYDKNKGVCDDYFTDDDAMVACRELTHEPREARALLRLDGHSDFHLDNLICVGMEGTLGECPKAGVPGTGGGDDGDHNCQAFENAGVVCYTEVVIPKAPDLKAECDPGDQGTTILSWDAPKISFSGHQINYINSIVNSYKIEVSEDGGTNWNKISENKIGSTKRTYSHTGLSPGDERHYRILATNSKGTGPASDVKSAVAGCLGDVNRAPVFSDASTTRSVAENTLAGVNIGAPVTATDPDNDTLSYSLEGPDAASFDIVSSSGQLKTKMVPNYETKSSYSVTVKATDPSNASDTITVTISVTNVDELGAVTFSYPSPFQLNEVLTATLSDPDGSTSGETWIWERSLNQNSGWTVIPGATSASYTVVVGDEDNYLRATATYTDAVFGSGKTAQAVSNKVPNLNWPPMFEIAPPTFSIPENSVAEVEIGTPVTAADQEMDPLTYSLDDTDGASFDIDSSTGQIETKAPLDYETKDVYSVTVTARDRPVDDPEVQSDTITVTINVTNEDDPGELTLSSMQPQVDTLLEATLTDPDGSVTGENWVWEKSTSRTNGWSTISGATSASYTPVAGDVDNYLRAKVTYTDRHGPNKMAYVVSDLVVRVEPPSNRAPEFSAATATRSVDENTPPGRNVGAPVTATDPDTNDTLTYSLEGPDAASFALADPTSGQIKTKDPLDYGGPKNSYSVTVKATDPSGLYDTIEVTINVRDVNESVSPPSNTKSPSQITRSTPTVTVPRAPASLTATPGDAEVALNWRAPGDGGSAIKYYEYNIDGGAWTSTGGKSTSYTVTGLTNGETYEFRVRAVNSVGPGAESKPARATPATVPGAPRNLTLTSGSQYMMLIWERPADNGGLPITGYEYSQKEEDGSFGEWTPIDNSAPGDANETSYTVTGLTNGETYEFRVRAVNSVGPGAESKPARATPTTVPGAPRNLTLTSGSQYMMLIWERPADNGGLPITGYEYSQKEEDGSFGEWTPIDNSAPGDANETSYTVTGLTNGETYEFRVRAVNSVGPGAESKPARATPATVPGAPRNLTLTSGSQYMMLIWERPADNGGLPITGYEYSQKEEDGSFGEWTPIDNSAPGDANETSYAVTGLKNGTIYSFRVRAVNTIGPGDPSAEATAEVNTPSFRRAKRVSLNILPTFGRTMLRNSVDALTWRLDSVLSGSFERTGMFRLMDQHVGLHEVIGDNIWDDPDQWEDLSLKELLYGSSFIIEAGVMLKKPKEHPKEDPKGYAGEDSKEDPKEYIREYPEEDSADKNMWIDEDKKPMVVERRGGIGFWGKADYNNLSVSSDEWFTWDGRIVSGYMGVDRWLNEEVLTGLSVSLTKGDFDYTDTTPGEGGRGDYYVKMISVSPYVSWFLSDDAYIWGAVGYGRGQVDNIDDEEVQSVTTSDLSYKSVAAGGSGRLFDVGDTTFSLKSEAFKVWMDVEGDDYLIDEMSLGVHQLRLSMEGSYEYRFASGTWFNPLVEVALRHDGGDGETGTGVELGGGFLYEDPNLGLSVSGRGRWLAAHSSDEFSQWGVGGTVIFDTGADKRGALFSVSPEWGDTSSGVDSLWERGVEGLSSEDGGANDMHLDAEFGYGLSALGGDGLFTPYSGLRVGGDGWRQYRLGSRLDLGRSASLSLETDRRQSDTTKPEHGIMLRGKLNF